MSDLGRQLRDARLARGLSLDDVQEMTKIRKRYLEAIEAGDFKVLPGSFYVRAFIKTYAEAVGINPDELLQEHQDVVPEPEAEPVMEPVVQPRRAARRNAATASRSGKLLSTILMWTFPILIIVLVWVFVIKQNSSPQIAENKPATEQQQQGNKGNTGGTATTPPSTNTTPESSGEGSTSQQPNGGGAQQGGESTSPESTGTTDGEATGTPEGTPESTPEGGTGTTDASTAPVITEAGKQGRNTIFDVNYTGSGTVKVNIAATGQSWLEVYKSENSSGERLFFNNTESGQNLSYDLTDSGLYIKSGNSRATNITINGQPITDGKATSRIILKLIKAAPSGDAAGTAATGDGTTTDSTSTSGTTDSESTSSGN
ncbi:RodZ family helix-turn-helix domain-containing protein [Paenibacillus campi]|uniref:helix-turn-helix domain-containing protein n=1 Tax=Paenibacillus campi TaxID=3106031 RepID=UPI002AFEA26D|nr:MULTISPECIES: RodZ family helix-turn-helix domain-containing protein [unclassified Paenibacillus]